MDALKPREMPEMFRCLFAPNRGSVTAHHFAIAETFREVAEQLEAWPLFGIQFSQEPR